MTVPAVETEMADNFSNMVDVFDIAPQGGTTQNPYSHFAYAGQGARLARYQHLVAKLNADAGSPPTGIKVGWLADEDNIELNSNKPESVKTVDGDDDALVGTFADAAAAAATTTTATTNN